jgi:septation ring formation regulator EzrA
MTPYEESQLLSMMQQMMAQMSHSNAQINAQLTTTNAHLAKLKHQDHKLRDKICNLQSPTLMVNSQWCHLHLEPPIPSHLCDML